MKPDETEQRLSADLLVIGGGFGGLFAAIRARELGVRDVLIVDKGAVGLTGQSRMAAGATIFVHPGDDLEQWADAVFVNPIKNPKPQPW